MKHFYLHLSSDASTHSSSTAAKFVAALPQCIDLEGDWEVSLIEIVLPGCWNNVTGDEYWFRLNDRRFEIPDGCYERVYDVLKIMGKQINEARPHPRNWPKVTVLERQDASWIESWERGDDWVFATHRGFEPPQWMAVYMDCNESPVRSISFSPAMIEAFGFERGKSTYGCPNMIIGAKGAKLKPITTAAYVLVDLVQPITVGHAKVRLLRVVFPNENRILRREPVHATYVSPVYVPVATKHFRSIEVNITTHAGRPISFGDGEKTTLLLHFKRIDRRS